MHPAPPLRFPTANLYTLIMPRVRDGQTIYSLPLTPK